MDPLHSCDSFPHIPILECMPDKTVTVHVLHKSFRSNHEFKYSCFDWSLLGMNSLCVYD